MRMVYPMQRVRVANAPCYAVGDPGVVSAAEATLGLKFPSGYRLFVTQLGAGSFGAQEILGGDSDDFVNSGIPDSVWKTLKDCEQLDLPASMIVIYFDGGLIFLCWTRPNRKTATRWRVDQSAPPASEQSRAGC
jgi:hypothetical protein